MQDIKPTSITTTISRQDELTRTIPIQISKTTQTQTQKQIQRQIQQQRQQLKQSYITTPITTTVPITSIIPPVVTPPIQPITSIIPPVVTPPIQPITKIPVPPPIPLLTADVGKKGKRKPIDLLGKGYRYRKWHTLTLGKFLGR